MRTLVIHILISFNLISIFASSVIAKNEGHIVRFDTLNLKVSDDTVSLNQQYLYCEQIQYKNPSKAIQFLDLLNLKAKELNDKQLYLKIQILLGKIHTNLGKNEEAKAFFFNALNYYLNKKDTKNTISTLNRIGAVYKAAAEYDKAIEIYNYALKLGKETNEIESIAYTLNGLGIVYKTISRYDKALDCYFQILDYEKLIKDKLIFAKTEFNIGNVYFVQEKPAIAMKYYNYALERLKINSNKGLYANIMIGMGAANSDIKRYAEAIIYYDKALKIKSELNDLKGIAIIYNNIAILYTDQKKYEKGLEFYKKAYQLHNQTNDKLGVASTLNNIGILYKRIKNYNAAMHFLKQSLDISSKIGLKYLMRESYQELWQLAEINQDYKNARFYLIQFNEIKDSIYNAEISQQMNELQVKYDTEKKDKQLVLLRSEERLNQLRLNKDKSIRIILALAIVVTLLIISFISYHYFNKIKLFRLLSNKNTEIRRQQEEIIEQRNRLEELLNNITLQNQAIENQKIKIESQNFYITSSIEYAKKIQEAILVPLSSIVNPFPESFVLFKPKDIVSGDFFWMIEKSSRIYFAAVDCTGHGVPGAFMSIIGHNLLNKTLENTNLVHPADILNDLNFKINETFKSNNTDKYHVKDGMDLALCVYDSQTMILEYAGAFNPLYIIRNRNLLEYKADCQPIEVNDKIEMFIPFTNHQIRIAPNDSLYILSDGFIDQFGGDEGRKFSRAKFRKTLINIQELPMIEQKRELEDLFNKWRSGIQQMDDILIVGIRFS